MKYRYTGVTRQKEKVTGVLDADDEVEANLKLRSMQVRPLSLVQTDEVVNPVTGEEKVKVGFSMGKPIDLKGMVVFTRQFSSLIDSGVPVVQCLDILQQQERRPIFKQILISIKQDIEGGAGLAESLAKHPKAFTELFVRIVEAGEISGTLDKALRRVGIQLEKLGRLRAKVIGAMVYPCITMFVAVIVLMFLLVKVIPEISKLYSESAAELPTITQKVLALSQWVQDNYLMMVGVMAAAIIGGPFLYRMDRFRDFFDPFIIRVPGFGSLIKKSSIARFTRTMSTLVSSGVPLLNSFDICMKLMSNRSVQSVIGEAMAAVQEGKSIASGLGSKNLFPPMVIHMVSIGEMTGKLDELLGKVADIYDDEVDDAVSTLTGLIQPVMIIVVGIIIAFLLVAMYLPIFQLAEKVTGGA
jgi:type IV pilus assembly protein PilC